MRAVDLLRWPKGFLWAALIDLARESNREGHQIKWRVHQASRVFVEYVSPVLRDCASRIMNVLFSVQKRAQKSTDWDVVVELKAN